VSLSVDQSRNHISESTQRKIDLRCLFHPLTSYSCLAGAFRAGEVDQVQFRGLVFFISFLVVLLGVDVDGEDAVRPRRLRVHIGGPNRPTLKSQLHVVFHLGNGVHFNLQQLLDKNALFGTFLEVHLGLGVLAEQVVYLFIVDLDEAATNEVVLAGIVLGYRDDLAESARNDPARLLTVVAAHHRVRLTAARLAVREDRPVVPVEHVIDEGKGALLVYQTLSAIWGEDVVEGETFGLLFGVLANEIDLVVLGVHPHDAYAAAVDLLLVHRTASHHHLHGLRHTPQYNRTFKSQTKRIQLLITYTYYKKGRKGIGKKRKKEKK